MEGFLLFLLAGSISIILGYTFDKINEKSEKEELKKKIRPDDKAREFFRKARKCEAEENYFEAIDNYEYAIRFLPKALYYNNMAYCFEKVNSYKSAYKHYSKAIELEPNDIVYRNNRGLLCKEFGNIKLAIEDWEYTAKLGSEEAKKYLNRYSEINNKKKAKTKNRANEESANSDIQEKQNRPKFNHELSNFNEKWKPISGYKRKYWISSLGRVESIWDENNPRLLVTDNQRGWPRVSLYRNVGNHREETRRAVAFLVAENFIENPNNYSCVDFLDGDFKNVEIDNLIWVDYAYTPSFEETPYVRTYTP